MPTITLPPESLNQIIKDIKRKLDTPFYYNQQVRFFEHTLNKLNDLIQANGTTVDIPVAKKLPEKKIQNDLKAAIEGSKKMRKAANDIWGTTWLEKVDEEVEDSSADGKNDKLVVKETDSGADEEGDNPVVGGTNSGTDGQADEPVVEEINSGANEKADKPVIEETDSGADEKTDKEEDVAAEDNVAELKPKQSEVFELPDPTVAIQKSNEPGVVAEVEARTTAEQPEEKEAKGQSNATFVGGKLNISKLVEDLEVGGAVAKSDQLEDKSKDDNAEDNEPGLAYVAEIMRAAEQKQSVAGQSNTPDEEIKASVNSAGSKEARARKKSKVLRKLRELIKESSRRLLTKVL